VGTGKSVRTLVAGRAGPGVPRLPQLPGFCGSAAVLLVAQTPAGIVSALARDIADTLATTELSEWLTQHDADPMHMSPAEFGAFVVSEAERAAVLLPAS
jgi:tripartite-type tricarboxylate transporter receptor subunit TctC